MSGQQGKFTFNLLQLKTRIFNLKAGAMSPKKFGDRKFVLWLCPRISGTVCRKSAMSPKKIRGLGVWDRKLALQLCLVPDFFHLLSNLALFVHSLGQLTSHPLN